MEFHLIRNGKQEGPFTVEELSQQGISPESEVWAPGMADWMQAGDVPELTAVLQRAEFEASQQAARIAENQPPACPMSQLLLRARCLLRCRDMGIRVNHPRKRVAVRPGCLPH